MSITDPPDIALLSSFATDVEFVIEKYMLMASLLGCFRSGMDLGRILPPNKLSPIPSQISKNSLLLAIAWAAGDLPRWATHPVSIARPAPYFRRR